MYVSKQWAPLCSYKYSPLLWWPWTSFFPPTASCSLAPTAAYEITTLRLNINYVLLGLLAFLIVNSTCSVNPFLLIYVSPWRCGLLGKFWHLSPSATSWHHLDSTSPSSISAWISTLLYLISGFSSGCHRLFLGKWLKAEKVYFISQLKSPVHKIQKCEAASEWHTNK